VPQKRFCHTAKNKAPQAGTTMRPHHDEVGAHLRGVPLKASCNRVGWVFRFKKGCLAAHSSVTHTRACIVEHVTCIGENFLTMVYRVRREGSAVRDKHDVHDGLRTLCNADSFIQSAQR
jgi:hypothetical protein